MFTEPLEITFGWIIEALMMLPVAGMCRFRRGKLNWQITSWIATFGSPVVVPTSEIESKRNKKKIVAFNGIANRIDICCWCCCLQGRLWGTVDGAGDIVTVAIIQIKYLYKTFIADAQRVPHVYFR